jgi:hypothetical protein
LPPIVPFVQDPKSLPVRFAPVIVTEYEHGLGSEQVQPPGSTCRTVYVPGLTLPIV